MKNIKKFKDFKLNEDVNSNGFSPTASFGLSPLSAVNSMGSNEPKDPNLSHNPWDRHQNNILDQFNRMGEILKTVFATGKFNLGTEFEENIEDLTIVKIIRNNSGSIDIFIKFIFIEEIFYGVFRNFTNNPEFKSRILDLPELRQHGDNIMRLVGLIKETLIEWFKPIDDTNYICLSNYDVYDEMGNIFTLPKGAKIFIEDCITTEEKPIIYLSYNSKNYSLSSLNYYFFNWYFKIEDKQEFYI